jgi:hypothetical protein
MKTIYWVLIAAIVWGGGFVLGYSISSKTGTEPGYFEAVEAAGYGGGSELKIEGLSEEMQKYYQELSESEE